MTPEQLYNAIVGSLLWQMREKLELTQHGVAMRTGVSQTTISRIEQGTTVADLFTVHQLAAILGMPFGDFFRLVDDAFVMAKDVGKRVIRSDDWMKLPDRGLRGLADFVVAVKLNKLLVAEQKAAG